MPDTGEDREIPQRVNAKEAEIESTATKLLQKIEPPKDRSTARRRRIAKKKGEAESRNQPGEPHDPI